MAHRYAELTKMPQQPPSRLFAVVEIDDPEEIEAPASADTEFVLRELDAKDDFLPMIMILAVALPAREAVWWGCLAARDYLKAKPKFKDTCIKAAEAWVFDPKEETLEALEVVLAAASPKDKTSLCALAALHASGSLGTGEKVEFQVPVASVVLSVFGINMLAWGEAEDQEQHLQMLIERGLDIARGGNGHVETPKIEKKPAPVSDETQAEAEGAP